MAETETPYLDPDPLPLYVVLALLGGISCYFFFLGTFVVRLWFYKGELGPAPEKFVIIRDAKLTSDHEEPSTTDRTNFQNSDDTAISTGLDPRSFSTATTINMQHMGDPNEIKDLRLRMIVREEQEVARMPAFDADDCGEERFPDIPIAYTPVEEVVHPTKSNSPERLGLKLSKRRDWLSVDKNWIQYLKYHDARTSILASKKEECIFVAPQPHAEEASEELLLEVAAFLVQTYPAQFTYQTSFGKKHIRNELTHEDYSLARPFVYPPIEICARLVNEDFQIFMRNEFGNRWYLNASATLFPSGWHMRSHTNPKSVQQVYEDIPELTPLWMALPDILHLGDFPTLSSYGSTSGPLTRTDIYMQTSPSHSLASTLHITRPINLFAGTIRDLASHELLVRTETQMFGRLPKSGAVVLTTRTTTETLKDMAERMGMQEKEGFLWEVNGWGADEAKFKGRGLWICVVERVLRGQSAFRDDVTVYTSLTRR